jgi:hypothetical protein
MNRCTASRSEDVTNPLASSAGLSAVAWVGHGTRADAANTSGPNDQGGLATPVRHSRGPLARALRGFGGFGGIARLSLGLLWLWLFFAHGGLAGLTSSG